jgi:phage terminase Nu1 subunit (DNA packaging protein)
LNIAVGLSRTITEGDAAHLLGRAPATLRNWRFAGCPIAFQRIGGRVRYTLRDLAAWLLDNRN